MSSKLTKSDYIGEDEEYYYYKDENRVYYHFHKRNGYFESVDALPVKGRQQPFIRVQQIIDLEDR